MTETELTAAGWGGRAPWSNDELSPDLRAWDADATDLDSELWLDDDPLLDDDLWLDVGELDTVSVDSLGRVHVGSP